MMPILVKGNDVRSGTKANARQGWLRPVTADTGILNLAFYL